MIGSRIRSFVLGAFLTACGARSVAPNLPPLQPIRPQDSGYHAAVAIADITPPLSLSLFGHGPEARVATGVRLRLRCEAFVIAQSPASAQSEDIVALVPCDLQSMSMVVQRKAADILRSKGVPIGPDRLFIMATHTHAGPAHYFEARFYSGPFSSMEFGYDQRVVDFLAERIAGAVKAAFDQLQPACLGWKRTYLFDMTVNRSYVPFLANESAETYVRDGLTVDPSLFVLRLNRRAPGATDCNGSTPFGVLAVFGMHPTGVPNTNDLYHGDIFGFAVRSAESELSPPAPPPAIADPGLIAFAPNHVVVGLANGIDGDVSPRVSQQSFDEARRLGRELGQRIAALAVSPDVPQSAAGGPPQGPSIAMSASGPMTASGPLKHASWDLWFPQGQYGDSASEQLCSKGELGMASAGGAPDGPTRARIIPAANAGFLGDREGECHGRKEPLRMVLGSHYDFPEVGSLSLVQVADGILATAPGEMTTMTGFRIRSAISQRFPKTTIAVVGLTNQYFQYFATHEEYAFQYYEGASTLYGEHTESFLVRHFGALADYLAGRPFDSERQRCVNDPAPLDMSPSPMIKRWPDEELAPRAPTEKPKVDRVRRQVDVGWEMEIPLIPSLWTSDRRLFRVEVLSGVSGSQVIDDDLGSNIEVRTIPEHVRVRWIPDAYVGDPRCDGHFRLAVRGTLSIESQPFVIDCKERPRLGQQQ